MRVTNVTPTMTLSKESRQRGCKPSDSGARQQQEVKHKLVLVSTFADAKVRARADGKILPEHTSLSKQQRCNMRIYRSENC